MLSHMSVFPYLSPCDACVITDDNVSCLHCLPFVLFIIVLIAWNAIYECLFKLKESGKVKENQLVLGFRTEKMWYSVL